MMDAKQIREWVATLPDDAKIGVDDGGLCIQVLGSDEYLEIGGMPLAEGQADDPDECDCDERSWHGEMHDSACRLSGLRITLCECGRRREDCTTFDDELCSHGDRA